MNEVFIEAPFKDYTKEELLEKYVDSGFDIEDLYKFSWSCYSPHNGKECGKCPACRRKFQALELVASKVRG